MQNHPTTSSGAIKKNGIILLCSMGLTFALLRVYLHISPDTDLNVGRYNIHHLFTGLLLIVAGGIPLAIFQASSRKLDLARWIFGAGLGMALDEWVFLIATDGSNASYLLPVSLWGGVVVIGVACVYTAALTLLNPREQKSDD
ncbi:MAG: hypothetical protein AB7U82_02890 [Blastocatellales bacterium]